MASKLEAFNAYELPVKRENEALILSNAIHDYKNREMFMKKVAVSDFRMSEFRTIAWAIKKANEEKMDINIDSVLLKSSSAPDRNAITSIFLNDMITSFGVVPNSDYERYIKELKIDSIKSQILDETFSSLYKICLNPAAELGEVEMNLDRLKGIVKTGYSSSILEFKGMDTLVSEYRESLSKGREFRTTGFRQLDAELNEGLRGGAITLITALPGLGKSSFTLSMMKNLANKKVPTAQFALEMNNMSLVTKLLSFNTQLPSALLTKDIEKLTDIQRQVYDYEMRRLSDNKCMWLNDTPSQSLSQIREQTMMLQDHLNTQYIVIPIDLFGKIKDFSESDNFARDYEKKLNEVQVMVRELCVHYVLVAQINRGAVKGKLRRPKMSDMKNAGAFEEVADNIFAIHRPYYDSDKALKEEVRKKGVYHEEEDSEEVPEVEKYIAELLILKQRAGANNKLVNFFMDPKTTRFQPWDTVDQEIMNQAKYLELNKAEEEY